MKKMERQEFARELFHKLALDGWRESSEHREQGGHSGICVVEHRNGARGVFRTLPPDADSTLIDRFHRELRILADLHHPNVMHLVEYTRMGDQHWYISELGRPFDLYWEDRRKQLSDNPEDMLREAVELLKGLSRGLGECHRQGVVHRDIKPANIVLMDGDSSVCPILIDFGVAYVEDEPRITELDESVGNARYSPEAMRYRQSKVPPWFDLFELSQVMMWMLWRERPVKHYWQRPVDWRFVEYDSRLPRSTVDSLRAVTAICAHEEIAPADGLQMAELLERHFPAIKANSGHKGIDPHGVAEGRCRAESADALKKVEDFELIEAGFPAAAQLYDQLRAGVLEMLRSTGDTIEWRQSTDADFAVVKRSMAKSQGTIEATLFELQFGKPQSFQFRIQCVVHKPSLRGQINGPALPDGCNPFAFYLQRYANLSRGTFPSVTWVVTIERTGALNLRNESMGEPSLVSVADILNHIRGCCSDQSAWESISHTYV